MSFVLFCFLWIALVNSQIGNLTQSSKWVYEVYAFKESHAQEINTKKVVIISGSNALFGFDSAKLENYWNTPVINGSVHAGLGLPYILHKSKKILNRGDIAILPLEYSFYQADGKPSEVYSDYILSRDSAYFRNLSMTEQLMVVSSVSFKRLYQGIKLHFNSVLKPTIGVYGIHNINSHGDQINTEPSKMTHIEFSAIDRLHAEIISSSEISSNFIQSMDNYFNWAKDSGVCIITMPPNHMFFYEYKEINYTSFLSKIKGYYASRDIMFVGSPFSYMYEKKYYYNTSYHLNSDGVKNRTMQVINDIGKEVGTHCKSI